MAETECTVTRNVGWAQLYMWNGAFKEMKVLRPKNRFFKIDFIHLDVETIFVLLAKHLQIDNVRALKLFYESETCRKLHDKSTGPYLYGDLYMVDEFMREMEDRQ